jgi:undecaprenyl-phosphate 4-deoxy-4-formamido-L-arabinose transferase
VALLYDSDVDGRRNVEFSIIVTSYFEEKSIDEFVQRLLATIRALPQTFEIILVNDGSTDATFERQRALFMQHTEIVEAIDLFRNVGQVAAISCGIVHATGQNFVFIDSDLQLDPEELPLLIKAFSDECDIVSGARRLRKDPIPRRIASRIGNVVMRKVSRHTLSDYGCTFKICRGDLVRAFGFGPYKRWKTAFVFSQARTVREVPVTHHPRRYGKSGWSAKKLLNFLFDSAIGFSAQPFQFLSMISAATGILLAFRIALDWFFPVEILPDVTHGLLLNAIFINIFICMALMSAVGEFTFRVHARIEGDPIYVIRRRLSRTISPHGVTDAKKTSDRNSTCD